LGLRHIAIDGKTLRHSKGGASPPHNLHLVSARATSTAPYLEQDWPDDEKKSDEPAA
jgi:hypothetical protein